MSIKKPTVQMIRVVQSQLNKLLKTSLTVDGSLGPLTFATISQIPMVSSSWSPARQFVGALQYICTRFGINTGAIDGYFGLKTERAYVELLTLMERGKVNALHNSNVNIDQQFNKIIQTTRWPRGTTPEMNKFFGPVGTNMSKVTTPYPLKIAWALERSINRFTCHKKVVESVQEAMEDTLEAYGYDGIVELGLNMFGGCLNVRKKRGGSNYSMHSWGAAIDWMPTKNRLPWRADKAELAKPVYNDFWAAWEKQGWVSLGRAKGFDYMHIQACTL